MQPFHVVPNLLRTLYCPVASLQQSEATPVVKRACPLAPEEPADNSEELTQWAQPEIIEGLRALVETLSGGWLHPGGDGQVDSQGLCWHQP